MKQTKVVLAIAALLGTAAGQAAAQTSVSLSGLVDMYAGSVRYSGDATRKTVINNGGMTTSWFGFSGTEDLGGGLKADFAVNGFFLGDTGASGRFPGDNLFSRNAYVGLSGSFGRVTIGRNSAPSFLPAVLFNPFGDSFQFSPIILHTYVPSGPVGNRTWAATTAGDSGWSNLVQYSSPTMNGVQANLYYQPGEQSSDARNYGANMFYTNGPLGLTAAYTSVAVSNPNPGGPVVDATSAPVNFASITKQRGWFAGARYDFGPAKGYATYRSNSNDSTSGRNLDDRTSTLGVSVPAGAGAFLAAYAHTSRTGTLVGADRSRSTATVGYDYKLSVRTDLYGMYMSDRLNTAARSGSYGVGVRHRF